MRRRGALRTRLIRSLPPTLFAASLLLAGGCEEDPFALRSGDLESRKPPVTTDAGNDASAEADASDLTKGRDVPDASGPMVSPENATYCTVKPILERYCTSCHVAGGVGPMPLESAADFHAAAVSDPGKAVYQLAQTRLNDSARPMPPPPKKLSDLELAIVNAWLARGAPADTRDCAPPKPPVEDAWDPEKCDAIYELRAYGGSKDTAFLVPAGAEIHPQIAHDAPWGDEKVQAIAFRPLTDNRRVLHHWILYGPGRVFLAGWAPGDDTRPPLPDDVGMDMPTGSNVFTLDMHYYNNFDGAVEEPDQSGLAICVLKQEHFRPKLGAVTMSLRSFGDSGLVLAPRNSVNAPATHTCNVVASSPVHLMTSGPHAHKYAVRMEFTVKKKSGETIVLHDGAWVFGEQGTYPVPGGDVVVDTGDVITTTCYYTNYTSRDVRFGESTESEMCFNFATYWPKGALNCR